MPSVSPQSSRTNDKTSEVQPRRSRIPHTAGSMGRTLRPLACRTVTASRQNPRAATHVASLLSRHLRKKQISEVTTTIKEGVHREDTLVLRQTWLKVIEKLGPTRLVIGGKSMGGRTASLVANEAGVAGLVCLGYPFHLVGKPGKLRVEHLKTIKTPTLIVQGERDPLVQGFISANPGGGTGRGRS
jgi:hypothetical protein